jgi:protein subunit release factor B
VASSFVSRLKQHHLQVRMQRLGIGDDDLEERFILGSGRGGQKVNKTSSCVYLKHGPTGIEIKCQRARSRELNRYLARTELCERIEETVRGEKSRRQSEIERIRRQKRRRSRRQKQRMLEEKHKHSEKKARRRPVRPTGHEG